MVRRAYVGPLHTIRALESLRPLLDSNSAGNSSYGNILEGNRMPTKSALYKLPRGIGRLANVEGFGKDLSTRITPVTEGFRGLEAYT